MFRFGKPLGLFTVLLCLLAGSWPRPAAGGDSVTLYLQWTHQFQFAGYYAALKQGYYRDAGLDVAIVEGGPGVETFREVAATPGRYGTAHAAGLLARRARGAPLVVLASIFQHSPNVIIARADRGIATPQQLSGTRTIIWPGGDVELSAMLLNEGVDPSPFRQKPRGDNVQDLIDGKVDAIDGYITNEAFTVRKAGVPVNIISPVNYGVDFYGDTLITSERELRDHPDRVKAFRAASLRGWTYALDHPDEIVDLILSVYQAKKSREHLLYEAQETRKLVMPGLIEVGHINPGRWARIADTLARVGVAGPDATFGDYLYDPDHLERERFERIRNYLTWGPPAALILIAIVAGWGWAWSLRRRVARATQALELQGEIVANMAEGVHLVRVSDSVIVYANPRLEAMFGYGAGELVGRGVSAINAAGDSSPEETAAAIMAELDKTSVWRGEIRNVREDGTPFWCAANASMFDHPEFGKVVVSVHTDITERKQVEEDLKQAHKELENRVQERTSELRVANQGLKNEILMRQRIEELKRATEEKLAGILSIAPEGIIAVDEDHRITLFNGGAEVLFGYTGTEIIGEPLDILLPPRFRQAHGKHIRDFARSSEVSRVMTERGEIAGFRKDGTEFPADASIAKREEHGRTSYTVLVHDITERKTFEERLRHAEKLEAVGQLTAGVAHEFNNILQGTAGYLEFLEEEIGDNQELRKLVAGASRTTWRAAEITKGLLAFGRKQLLRPRSVDLNDALARMSVLLDRTSGGRVETMMNLADDLWVAKVDPGQLETAVVNIALNARDAMPDGGTLVIETTNVHVDDDQASKISEARPGDYIKLTMSDAGIGMSAEVLEHAVEPFFTTKDVGDGTGLGLSMIYGFAQQSNGFVTIDSQEGRGTRVDLYLPRTSEPVDRRATE